MLINQVDVHVLASPAKTLSWTLSTIVYLKIPYRRASRLREAEPICDKQFKTMKMASATTSFTPSHPFSTSISSRAAAPMSPQPNPLTQLPNVDFNFEDLRQRMSAFTVKFDAFIERGRKRVLEERNEFRERLGELAGTSTIVILIHFRTR
jgi:hypothetical protein